MFLIDDEVAYTRTYYQAGIEKKESCHGRIVGRTILTIDKSITYDIARRDDPTMIDSGIPEACISLDIPVINFNKDVEKKPSISIYEALTEFATKIAAENAGYNCKIDTCHEFSWDTAVIFECHKTIPKYCEKRILHHDDLSSAERPDSLISFLKEAFEKFREKCEKENLSQFAAEPQYHVGDHVYLGLTDDDGKYFTGVIDSTHKKDNDDFYYGVTLDREFKYKDTSGKHKHIYADISHDGIRGRMFKAGEKVKFLPYPAASQELIGWITGWEFNEHKRYMYHIRTLSEDERNWKYYKVPISQIKPISTTDYHGGFTLAQGPRSNGKTYFDNYILWRHAMNSIYGLSPKDMYPATVMCKDTQSFLESPITELDFSVNPEKAYKLWHDAYYKNRWDDHVDAMSYAAMRYCKNTELIKEELGMNVTLSNKKETEELVEYQVNTPYSYRPKKIIFNGPATIVIWQDDSKTVVRCGENEEYDRKLAFKYALHKRYTEVEHKNYLRQFTKALEKTGDPQAAFVEVFTKSEMNRLRFDGADKYFKAIEKHFKKEFEG